MRPELAECRFCGGCLDKYSDYAELKALNGEWLEEMGNMITATVDGMKKVPSYSACCHERLSAIYQIN